MVFVYGVFLYFMFPFILLVVKKYKNVRTAYIVIFITFVLQFVLAWCSYIVQTRIVENDKFIHWFTYIFPITRLEDFVIGCNLGYIFRKRGGDRHKYEHERAIFTLLEAFSLLLLLLSWLFYLYIIYYPALENARIGKENYWGYSTLWTVPSGMIVLFFAYNKGHISKLLSNYAIVFLGDLSAYCFLLHHLVISYIGLFEQKSYGTTFNSFNIGICLLITILLSIAWRSLTTFIHNC